MKTLDKNFTFIDLFSGIGGFHLAMKKFSPDAKCVFASEINPNAVKVYQENFNMDSNNDIKNIKGTEIPDFDVLCAGFPCQSFSKAGYQQGFNDERGVLFNEIERIIKEKIDDNKKPKILILENVKNLVSHDRGNTWTTIRKKIIDLGFNVVNKPIVLGPNDFGIPQLRDRAIILAVDSDIYDEEINLIIPKHNTLKSINDYLEDSKTDKNNYIVSEREKGVLTAWDYFIKNLNRKIIGFPIWSDTFFREVDTTDYPEWKKDFVRKNQSLYADNKEMIDEWRIKFKIDEFIPTHRKFEWQAGVYIDSVFEGIIQFRPSGIRVKKPISFPTLVAMKHIPIIGSEVRYITPSEALKLQSFPEDFGHKVVGKDIYRLLGNTVNVDVIYIAFKTFINFLEERDEAYED